MMLSPVVGPIALGTHRRKSYISLNLQSEALPPLPEIKSADLRKQIFTHRSVHARPTAIFEDSPDDPSPDNEALEHLGDSVLNMVVTSLLQEVYPYLRVGPSTKIRSLVVGNYTLATITRVYKLNDLIHSHPAQQIALRASSNIQADVFEAYVGGLFKDRGLEVVKAWLHPLFRPYIVEAYRVVRIEHGLSPDPEPQPPRLRAGDSPSSAPSRLSPSIGHLSLFNQYLQQKNMVVEWVYTDSAGEGTKTTPIWIVRAMVDEQCFGRGRGNTKKAAKNEAAKEGLRKMGAYVPQPSNLQTV